MADKNYVKALRKAKSKKLFYTNILIFVPLGITLLISNITLIAPNIPWSMIPISIMIGVLVIHKLMLFRWPQRSIFSKDYLQYQTEKELRLIEFEDDMDELEAEKLDNSSLKLPELSHTYRNSDGELV